MANYDSRIPLSVNHPNIIGAMRQGQQMGAQANQIQQQNALRDLFQQQGGAIMQGNQNALAALSSIDPRMALDVQNTQQTMSTRQEKLDMLRAKAERDAQRLQMDMDAAALERERENLKRGLSAAMTAQTPEQWDAMARQFGADDLVGEFGNREANIAYYSGLKETLDRMMPGQSAGEQKIARIMSAYNVDRKTATGIADGVMRVSRDPHTDRIQITDLATNEVWEPSARGGQQGQSPAQTGAQPGAAEEQPGAQQTMSFGDAYEEAETAFGVPGMAANAVNAVTDFAFGVEAFPETGQAIRDFNVMREDITQDLQSAYNQKLPSWALRGLQELTPGAGGFEGPSKAQGKLRALGRKFEQELRSAEQEYRSNVRGMSPKGRAEAEAKISALRRSVGKINAALSGFEGPDAANENQTSKGVKWRVVE